MNIKDIAKVTNTQRHAAHLPHDMKNCSKCEAFVTRTFLKV